MSNLINLELMCASTPEVSNLNSDELELTRTSVPILALPAERKLFFVTEQQYVWCHLFLPQKFFYVFLANECLNSILVSFQYFGIVSIVVVLL